MELIAAILLALAVIQIPWALGDKNLVRNDNKEQLYSFPEETSNEKENFVRNDNKEQLYYFPEETSNEKENFVRNDNKDKLYSFPEETSDEKENLVRNYNKATLYSFPEEPSDEGENLARSVEDEDEGLFNYVGCYNDKSKRAITGGHTIFYRDVVVDNCFNLALTRKHKFFGVEGNECYTDAISKDGFVFYDRYGETSGCRNGRGGGWKLSVYEVNQQIREKVANKEYKSKGCYYDRSDRAISGGYTIFLPAERSIDMCFNLAIIRGHKYFAVENNRDCFTDGVPPSYAKYGKANGCHNGRGGGYRLSVYEINDKGNEEPAKWRQDGFCGAKYPLANGKVSECNPVGDRPCCSPDELWCGMVSMAYCHCPKCIDYRPIRCKGSNNGCCTSSNPCKVGDGDCDNDNDCEGELKCGKKNCDTKKYPNFEDNDDCCYLEKYKKLVVYPWQRYGNGKFA